MQDDPLKASMHSFLMSGQNMQEIGLLDNKVYTLAMHDHLLVSISFFMILLGRFMRLWSRLMVLNYRGNSTLAFLTTLRSSLTTG